MYVTILHLNQDLTHANLVNAISQQCGISGLHANLKCIINLITVTSLEQYSITLKLYDGYEEEKTILLMDIYLKRPQEILLIGINIFLLRNIQECQYHFRL
mgnify:FL=1